MLIRFIKFSAFGGVQHHAGDLDELPQDLAQKHIDDGDAVKVDRSKIVGEYAAFFPAKKAVVRK